MGTLAEEAAYLSGTQAILKSKIASNLGRTIPDNTNFRDYQNYILPPATWMPDPLWASLDDIADNQIGMIVRDRDDLGVAARCAFTITATASYVVDWGDGTSQTIASGTMADHTYTLGAGTPDSKGTTTFKVRISSTGTITRILMAGNVTGGVVTQTVQSVSIKASGITSMASAYAYCSDLQSVAIVELNSCISFSSSFTDCSSLVSFGNISAASCTSANNMFYLNASLREIGNINLPEVTTLANFCYICENLWKLGNVSAPKCADISSMLFSCRNLRDVGTLDGIGTSAAVVDGNGFTQMSTRSVLNLGGAKFSKIYACGTSARLSSITGLTFHASSAFGGTSPQINVSYTMMDRTALVALFNLLPTLVGKTINITGCIGTASLTADDRAIATGKGWTIIG